MRRVALESILGVRIAGGDRLVVAPRVPDAWPHYSMRLRLPDDGGVYEIAVENPTGRAGQVISVTVDGTAGEVERGAARVALARDGGAHRVVVTLGGGPVLAR
jgi:cyclic beta-1,2-glucan synthetase